MEGAAGSRRVVAGVDGTRNSIAALHRAVTEARRQAASLDVVLVIPGEPNPEAYAAGLDMLTELLIREFPPGLGVPVQRVVEHGDPGRTLVQVSRGADVLVIGARPGGAAGNPLGGEVVLECLDWAACPVIVCANHGVTAHV
jgi:nucleotide-binding universal stress UspA family protein